MNTLIRLDGCIAEANIIEPLDINEGKQKYTVTLNPIDNIFQRLESIIEDLQSNWLINKSNNDNPIPPTNIIQGSQVKLETIIKPKLLGWCEECKHDEQFLTRYVQAVGHIQIQKLGNCFLSFHILEPYSQDQQLITN